MTPYRFASSTLWPWERRKGLQGISSDAMRLLLDYPWPDNVRELKNAIAHAVVLAKAGQVEAWDLPAFIQTASPRTSPTLAQREEKTLLEILEECGWKKNWRPNVWVSAAAPFISC